MHVFDRLSTVKQHNGFYSAYFKLVKPYSFIRFLFIPYADEMLNDYRVLCPIIDFINTLELLFDIFTDTNEIYLIGSLQIKFAKTITLLSPLGFLSSTIFCIG